MKHTVESALQYGWSSYQWSICSNDYSTLTWISLDISKPTYGEILMKINELDSFEAMRLLRIRRNVLLQETDIKSLPDFPHKDANVRDAWITYRQELRDLLDSASPTLNDRYELDVQSVNWPTKPSQQSLEAT